MNPTPNPSTASASTPTSAPAGRGSTNSRGGAFEPNRPSSRRCHQSRHEQPGDEGDRRDRGAGPREVAGEGDDADVDGDELSAGDDRTMPPQPLGVGVEGDRGAGYGTVDSRPAAGSAPPVQRRRTRRARRRATVADPPAAAVTIAARQTEADQLRGRAGEVVRRGVAGRQVVGHESCQVGGECGRPLRRHGLGVVRQDEHEVVAATERGADLIDRVSRSCRCRRRRRARRESASVDRMTWSSESMTMPRNCGGEDVVRVARHAHGREQLAGGVAPHPCRGGRVLVQEVDDLGLQLGRRSATRPPRWPSPTT